MLTDADAFGSVAWAARIRQREAERTPAQVAADEQWMDDWLAGLPILPPLPLQPGQCIVVFNPRKGGSQVRSEGQGLVEYALILTLVAIVVVVILGLFGGALSDTFGNIIASI